MHEYLFMCICVYECTYVCMSVCDLSPLDGLCTVLGESRGACRELRRGSETSFGCVSLLLCQESCVFVVHNLHPIIFLCTLTFDPSLTLSPSPHRCLFLSFLLHPLPFPPINVSSFPLSPRLSHPPSPTLRQPVFVIHLPFILASSSSEGAAITGISREGEGAELRELTQACAAQSRCFLMQSWKSSQVFSNLQG